MREFDLGGQLAMYAGTAAGLLVVFFVVVGLVLLAKKLLRIRQRHRSQKL